MTISHIFLILPARARGEIILLLPMAMRRLALSVTRRWIKKGSVALDIWMRAIKYCGFGFGGDALNTLCDYLHQIYGVTNFVISPSGRNKQAIASYQKCGFKCLSKPSKEIQKKDFGISACADNIIMIKKVSNRPTLGKTLCNH